MHIKNWKRLSAPLTDDVIRDLRAGDGVLISGTIYAARDKAHQRFVEIIARNEALPFDFKGQIIYYVGPTPAAPGKISGSAGPTTSSRMDAFTEAVLSAGIKGMIGKGKRDTATKDCIRRFNAPYFSTFGGAGAYLAKRIIKSEIIAFDDLGPEAVYKMEVSDFPAVVINDIYQGDLYANAAQKPPA